MKIIFLLSIIWCFEYATTDYNASDKNCEIQRRQPVFFTLLRRHELWPRKENVSSAQNFIIGGYTADIANFPYQLSLRHGNDHICGASIISNYWALTAAHCLDDGTMASWISFRAGSPHRLVGGYIHHAKHYYLHPNYDKATLDFDAAVAQVIEPFSGNNVARIPLITAGTIITPNTWVTVSGWGVSDDGYIPVILQGLDIYTNSDLICEQYWVEQTTDKMFCAGGTIGQDTCTGDSGGAMVANGVQIGIVSWGRIECASDTPAVYTNISHPAIRSFIRSYVGI